LALKEGIMEVRDYDDNVNLIDNPTLTEFITHMGKRDVKVVAIHKPGSVIQMKDGIKYEVDSNGSFRRIIPKNSSKKRRKINARNS